jgi:hypothetical protein
MRFVAIIPTFLFSALCLAQESKPSLKLDVQMQIAEKDMPNDGKALPSERYEAVITATVENISDKDITVPTQTYDGQPSSVGLSGNPQGVVVTFLYYKVGYRQVGGDALCFTR